MDGLLIKNAYTYFEDSPVVVTHNLADLMDSFVKGKLFGETAGGGKLPAEDMVPDAAQGMSQEDSAVVCM